jgi:tRNA modification GTPase
VLAIICGKPNVGKSSLMNLLLKRDRVIVSPIPGTTRDAVEEMIGLKGIPVRLVDTAGIADTKDAVEREGVARSKRYLALADIAILVLDYSAKLDPGDMTVIKMVSDKKKVIVLNKCDLAKKIDMNRVRKLFPGGRIVAISVQKKKNIDGLEEALSSAIWAGGFTQGEGEIVSNARHKELLDKALGNMLSVRRAFGGRDAPPELIAIDLKEAMYHLGLITGRSVSDDLLNRIFERFCIGK